MKLDIRLRNLKIENGSSNRDLRESIDRCVRFALGRFGGRIRRAELVLSDVNGPRGGADQRCMLKVFRPSAEPIIIDVTDRDSLVAVGRASERAARRVRDQHVRRRDLQRHYGANAGRSAMMQESA